MRRVPCCRWWLLLAAAASALLAGPVVAADTRAEPARPDATDGTEVTSVASVDLARYAGLWHEIARIPNRFQKRCARGTTAHYALRDDGRLDVVNRCAEAGGDVDEARGLARVVDAESRARLQVSFVSFLGWRPFWGDYWIIGLDEDYRWAVVGHPDRDYGWVLARAPRLDGAAMARVRRVLAANGYDWGRFVDSPP